MIDITAINEEYNPEDLYRELDDIIYTYAMLSLRAEDHDRSQEVTSHLYLLRFLRDKMGQCEKKQAS